MDCSKCGGLVVTVYDDTRCMACGKRFFREAMAASGNPISEQKQPLTNEKRWSRKYPRCQRCKRTEFKHGAKGLCHPCYNSKYSIQYAKEHPEMRKRLRHRHYENNKGKENIKHKVWLSNHQFEQKLYRKKRWQYLKKNHGEEIRAKQREWHRKKKLTSNSPGA